MKRRVASTLVLAILLAPLGGCGEEPKAASSTPARERPRPRPPIGQDVAAWMREPVLAKHRFEVDLGRLYEVDFQMLAGQEVSAEFLADAPLHHDTHYHPDEHTVRVIETGEGQRKLLILRAPTDGIFSFSWFHIGAKAGPIGLDVVIRGRPEAYAFTEGAMR